MRVLSVLLAVVTTNQSTREAPPSLPSRRLSKYRRCRTQYAKVATSAPDVYLLKIQPAALQTQYVPVDPGLWALHRYEDFVMERRKLLATAINDLLASLM